MMRGRSCATRAASAENFRREAGFRQRKEQFRGKDKCRPPFNFNKFAEPRRFDILQFGERTLKHHAPAKPNIIPRPETSSNHTNH